MGEPAFWARFVLAVLGVWRVAHLLSKEDGPGALIARVRATLGRSRLGEMMDCFGCVSLWVAAPFAWLIGGRHIDEIAIWLALSGGAYLLDLWTPEPIVIDHGENPVQTEPDHGML